MGISLLISCKKVHTCTCTEDGEDTIIKSDGKISRSDAKEFEEACEERSATLESSGGGCTFG